MTTFPSNVIENSFDGWFNKARRSISFTVEEKSLEEFHDLIEDAFHSGYTMGVSDYTNSEKSWETDEVYYMCKTDFEFELGYAAGGNCVYSSVEDLKECRPCVESCGIVAVKIEYAYTVEGSEE